MTTLHHDLAGKCTRIAVAGLLFAMSSSAAHAGSSNKCWIAVGSADDSLVCSLGDAGQLGIGSATIHYSYSVSGIPQSGRATVTAGQANATLANIPKSAYPLSLTVSASLQKTSVEGVNVGAFSGVFANTQATTFTESRPLQLPNAFNVWSLEVTNQAEGLLEAVFSESASRKLSIAPFYIGNDGNSTHIPVQSSFVVTPDQPTRVVVPAANGAIKGTLTLIFETGEMKEIAVQIPGPGAYVVDGSGLRR
jgi:hypothetical protein